MDVKFSRSGEDDSWILEVVDGKNYYLLEICDDNDICVLKRIDGKTEAKDISIEELFDFDKDKK